MIDISYYQKKLKTCSNKIHYFAAVSLKVFGCELPENGDQPQTVGASYGEIYSSKTCAFLGTKRLYSSSVL